MDGTNKTEWWDVDPEVAADLLKGNLGNRRIMKRIVSRYAGDMKAGRWKVNGSTISIYDDGERLVLLNGQHRLLALIEAGMTIRFLIVWETDPSVFSTIDVGATRPTSTVLSLAGYTNTNALAAAVRQVMNYHTRPDEAWEGLQIGTPEVLAWLQSPEGELMYPAASMRYGEAHSKFKVVNSWYLSLDYLVHRHSKSADNWLAFHEGFTRGSKLPDESPILALREYTIRHSSLPGVSSAWVRQAHLACGLKAWNYWVADKSTSFFKYSKKSLPMPKIV